MCPTPAQAQETLANEAGPHLANHGQVGLPRFRQYPAERSQKEEVQKGSGHSAQSLETKEGRRKKQRNETTKKVQQKEVQKARRGANGSQRDKVIEKEKWERAADVKESRVDTDSVPLWCVNYLYSSASFPCSFPSQMVLQM